MTRQYELVERVLSYQPSADEALLNRAYVYAMKAHGNQKRASGAPFFSHPLEVAAILAEMRLDDATIATALLHDTIEDTDTTRGEIDALFGREIGTLVDGLTKIKKLDLVTKKAEQAENFRKLLLAISSDIRVLLVKLADRLHNMRTLGHMKPAKRKIIAEETMDIYAPLAGRMGMQWLREELEDHAFKCAQPRGLLGRGRAAQDVARAQSGSDRRDRGGADRQARRGRCRRRRRRAGEEALRHLEQDGAEADLARAAVRHLCVPHRRAARSRIATTRCRWCTPPGTPCPAASRITSPIPSRTTTSRSTPPSSARATSASSCRSAPSGCTPSPNMAWRRMRSTRTPTAAHAPKGVVPSQDSNAYRWLRHLVGMLLDGDNPEEFLEHTKLELFQDQVFCFTPKGRLIALPRGANPIDFAYAVHTDIGNTCVGAKINGRPMPLVTELRNGDEVEIICSKAQLPPSAWQSLAVTGKARSAIRRATRDAVRAQYGKLGREILVQGFPAPGEDLQRGEPHRGAWPPVAKDRRGRDGGGGTGRARLGRCGPRRVSRGEAGRSRAKRRRKVKRNDEGWFGLGKVMGLKFRWPGSSGEPPPQGQNSGIPIRGLRGDLPVNFADGGAVPGDRIVGILTPGQGITIYPIHAEALKAFDEEPERWIDVTWDIDEDNPQRFPAKITVTALNEPGSLAQVAAVIGEADGNIDNIKMTNRVPDYTEMLIDLEVWDLKHLNDIIAGLRAKDVVSSAARADA